MDFNIPAENIAALTAHIEKLNKRAARMGMDPIVYTIGETFTHSVGAGYGREEVFKKVTVEGEAPIIKGWTLVAAVEYLENGTEVVKGLDLEFKCPAEYRGVKPFCEHCNTAKVKRYTMILKNVETGEYKMVGKTCMKDFLGDDIEMVVRRHSWLVELIHELGDEDSDFYKFGGGGERHFTVEYVMGIAAHYTLNYGYKPAHFDMDSTKNAVLNTMFNPKASIRPSDVTDEDKKFAADAIAWIENSDDDNDFMLNVKNLVDMGYVTSRMLGYIIGAVGSYNAFLKREAAKKAEAATILNEHFGEVKKRYTLELTLIKLTDFEGYYGTTWIHTFKDNDGRVFVWFGSKRLRSLDDEKVEVGSTLKVKATVKDHGEYRGVAQTNITRVAPAK